VKYGVTFLRAKSLRLYKTDFIDILPWSLPIVVSIVFIFLLTSSIYRFTLLMKALKTSFSK